MAVMLAVAQPAEQPPQLGAQDAGVLEAAKQGFDGVEHHAFGADLLDGVLEPHEQALEIVFAGFLDLAAVDMDVVDQQLLLLDQLVEVVAQRAHVLRELVGVFFEGQQHAGFAVSLRAVHEEADTQQGFAGSRAARHQRGPACGQSAIGDVIESRYPGRRLLNFRPVKTLLGHESEPSALLGKARERRPDRSRRVLTQDICDDEIGAVSQFS